MITVVCAADGCISTFEPNLRGRPRLYCDDYSTKTAYSHRWRKCETHTPAATAVCAAAAARGGLRRLRRHLSEDVGAAALLL